MEMITSALKVIASWLGYAKHRSEQKNTPEMKEAKVRQQEADAFSEAEKVVANKDIEAFRKNIAE